MLDALLDHNFKHREEVREFLFSSKNEYVNKVMRKAIEDDANFVNNQTVVIQFKKISYDFSGF